MLHAYSRFRKREPEIAAGVESSLDAIKTTVEFEGVAGEAEGGLMVEKTVACLLLFCC
jgi:hypothetical protein